MSEKDRILEMHNRWNIDINPESEFPKFKNRLLTYLRQKIPQLTGGLDYYYSFYRGYPQEEGYKNSIFFQHSQLYYDICESKSINEIALALQVVLVILERQENSDLIIELVTILRVALDHSPFIDMEISVSENHIVLYPSGAELLDKRIINDTLAWLAVNQTVYNRFSNALKLYMQKDKTQYRNLLDELRSALELLVKDILSNDKSLEHQMEPLLRWIREKGAHKEIVNMFHKLLVFYCRYNNDAVKHGDEWSEQDIEYMIYQTGIFMRLLLVLNNEK